MLYLIAKLSLGVILLLVSTHAFVKLAEKISYALQVSPLIIGTTFVALGTSLPELSVSFIAAVNNDFGLAFGNIIGSNIVNILLVLPIGILIGKLRIGTTKTQRNAIILVGVTIIFLLVQSLALSSLFIGLFLIGLAIFFTITEYRWGVFGRTHEDAVKVNNHNLNLPILSGLVKLIFSLAGIIAGGILVVTSVEGISYATNYSTTILGLTLTAIVTSLPELLTTIFSQEDDQEKITIGNITGSNIYNLLFVGGVAILFGSTVIISTIEWIWLIETTILFAIILWLYKGNFVPRWVGLSLLFLLLVYLFTLGISKNTLLSFSPINYSQ